MKTLLEAFGPGMEVRVSEKSAIELGNNTVVVPEGTILSMLAGYSQQIGDIIDPNKYIIVNSDSGFQLQMPHTEAQKIQVEDIK